MEITKLTQQNIDGMIARDVFGLNIFSANRIKVTADDDPTLILLRELIGANSVGCLIGNLFDYAESPTELFGNTSYSTRYTKVQTGIYGGSFYDGNAWESFPPLYFPSIAKDFLDIQDNSSNLIQRILVLDAIAFFVSKTPRLSTESISRLLDSKFESNEKLIERATSLCDAVVTSQADCDFFTVYSAVDSAAVDAILSPPLIAAERHIRESNWFIENADRLRWDEEFEVLKCV